MDFIPVWPHSNRKSWIRRKVAPPFHMNSKFFEFWRIIWMTTTYKSGYLICGVEMIYFETIRSLVYAVCGEDFNVDASCTDGHYVCNTCHSGSANPLSEKTWQLSNLITAECLGVIAKHGGPRCCKRDTFLALQSAVNFLDQNFDIELPLTDPVQCEFSALNKECLECNCPFFVG